MFLFLNGIAAVVVTQFILILKIFTLFLKYPIFFKAIKPNSQTAKPIPINI
jgi:hypothetical protein